MPKKQLQTLTERRPVDQFFEHLNVDDFHSAISTGDEKYAGLSAALCDPQYARMSMAALLKKCGLTLTDCAEAMRSFYHAKGMMAAMQGVPQVYIDTVEDAKAHYVTCPTCEGSGFVSLEDPAARQKPCLACESTGKIRIPGDPKARAIVYDSMGAISKPAPTVAIQQNYMGTDLAANLNTANRVLGRNQIRRAEAPTPAPDITDAEVIDD